MYLNMNDPLIAEQNVPQKQDSSSHINAVVATIILWGSVTVACAAGPSILGVGGLIALLVLGYGVHLSLVCSCS